MVVLFEQKVWYLYGRECIRVVGFVLGRRKYGRKKAGYEKNNGVSFEFKRQKSDNGRDICVSLYEFVGSL